ncbi:ATP-grasp ribosomal peptide maturase [Nocardiopsis sp. HUAS JQ3]|uniref:ATP-grasp ribosomal peptide maturase n=1 Tax=Nocardiopsis sp. HUAS JQ3 TaxID=3061629 RepID=UPI0023A982C8|nr:ATP-grasp ribosomal peptide maturase [Nocardiopsis sp. HUAS JQ3]WDZ91324.1 ATP-grasp ribosomal peptide maturase [Nocardiopsis sp. HUAS JQ3]
MTSSAARKAVLVLTHTEDATADPVIHHLSERDVPVVRMDPGDFPASMTVEAAFDGNWQGAVHDAFRGVDLGSVRGVYYRRPSQFTLAEGMSGPDQRWAYREARMGFGGVLLALDCLWINQPSRMSVAEYKPVQLATAARVGLRVPRTIITNVPDHAADWAAGICGPVVYKPVGGALHVEQGRTRIVYASAVAAVEELRDPAVGLTAHCFQEWVDKAFEVRLTVVGQTMFAVAIHARSQAAHIDWRSDYDAHRYEVVVIPDDVRSGLERYMRAFGLVCGAADFVVSPGGAWTLLEVNPNGEWGWLADRCGLPIGQSIAELLEKGQM